MGSWMTKQLRARQMRASSTIEDNECIEELQTYRKPPA